jgi:hypothetical protein
MFIFTTELADITVLTLLYNKQYILLSDHMIATSQNTSHFNAAYSIYIMQSLITMVTGTRRSTK